MKEIATALCAAQKAMGVALKDSENPFFKSHYADYLSIWNAVKGPLTDNGLAVTQTFEYEGGILFLVTTLLHKSGESIRSVHPLFGAENKKIQDLGSLHTYLRRYSIQALLAVPVADDDGEAAMGRDKQATGKGQRMGDHATVNQVIDVANMHYAEPRTVKVNLPEAPTEPSPAYNRATRNMGRGLKLKEAGATHKWTGAQAEEASKAMFGKTYKDLDEEEFESLKRQLFLSSYDAFINDPIYGKGGENE
jgi:hypothetical protein